jgi:copper chaperone
VQLVTVARSRKNFLNPISAFRLDLAMWQGAKLSGVDPFEEKDSMCEAHRTHNHDVVPATVSGASIRVEDMTCGHCAATIQSAIESSFPGAKVTANPEARLVSVEGADLAKVREIIASAGYTPDAAHA